MKAKALVLCISELLESYVFVRGFKKGRNVEVFDDPTSWHEVEKEITKTARSNNPLQKPSIIRFGYDDKTGEIKAWDGSLAIHTSVIPSGVDTTWGSGYIDLQKKTVWVLNPARTRSRMKLDALPKQLQRFINGLEIVKWVSNG
jgi:hypothetical protein